MASPRYLTLPNAEHATVTGILELLPAVNTWLREILRTNARLGTRPASATIEERNEASLDFVAAMDLPGYNWTISESGEDITVMADR